MLTAEFKDGGKNIIAYQHYTKEHEEEVKRQIESLKPEDTHEFIEKAIKGEFDEKQPPRPEELKTVTDYYKELAKKLREKLEPMFEPGAAIGEYTRTLDETLMLSIGQNIFRRMRCPVVECDFRAPRKLSKEEKYAVLLKHYIENHLEKTKGKSSLATIKRVIGQDKGIFNEGDPFKPKGIEGHEVPIARAPNPESCHNLSNEDEFWRNATVEERREALEKLFKQKPELRDLEIAKVLSRAEDHSSARLRCR